MFDIVLILIFSSVPLFFHFNYKINIFLSWEGAYRLYLGQIPYKDFGLPLGFGYWLIPALFFHLFGPYLITLIKAQVFINILSGLAFWSILKSFQVNSGLKTLAVLLYCVSFSFNNFWPWYNHTVIVYQFIGFAFLFHYLRKENQKVFNLQIILSAFFFFLSLFTKQDAGAMGILVGLGIVLFYGYAKNHYKVPLIFLGYLLIFGFLFFLPFKAYRIGYWFNHGQPPHSSRLSILDLLNGILGGSLWIKFYLLLILLIFYTQFLPVIKTIRTNSITLWNYLFLLFTLGILMEALIFQVSSYVPLDNNIFFHSFSFIFILTFIPFTIPFEKRSVFISLALFILFWWSHVLWLYAGGVKNWLAKRGPIITDTSITINTFMIPPKDPSLVPVEKWIPSPFKSFKKIQMPPGTVKGIEKILNMPQAHKSNLKFLNMSELTPLEYELGFIPETGKNIPLWYHRGVGMFSSQTEDYCKKIKNSYYDLVLFEYIPNLNNFFPFKIQDTLRQYYTKVDQFVAPRNPTNQSFIEVYIKKN